MINILLVDHAIEDARSVSALLAASRSDNFKLDRVLGYREILRGFRSQAYDVCVIDSGLGNGLRLFAQARGLGCTVPVVLVTANNAGEVLEATRSGVADCLLRDELDAPLIERAICSVVEQARRASLRIARERRYLALHENVNAFIYTHDLDGNLTSINRMGERLIGYSQQEILGLQVSRLVAPGYRTRVRKMIERTLDAQVQIVEKVEFLTKEGHDLTVALAVHPIYEEGKATEIQGMASPLDRLRISRPRPQQARNLFGNRSEDIAGLTRGSQPGTDSYPPGKFPSQART